MTVTGEQARALRLRRHHLDRPLPSGGLVEAAAVCGVQNSPPRAWETALWNRVEGVTLPQLEQGAVWGKDLAPGLEHPGRAPGLSHQGRRGLSHSPCAPSPGGSPGSTPGESPGPWTPWS